MPTQYSFPDAPKRWSHFHYTLTPFAGGGAIRGIDNSQIHYHYARQDPAVINDAMTYAIWLRDGTYTFSARGIASTSYGRVTWSMDGVDFIVNQDWYNGGTVYNLVQSGTVVISNGQLHHVLKGTVASKNASSAGYNLLITDLWFRQAAD